MVNSADEPPLLNKIHSWAKKPTLPSLNTFRKSKQDSPSEPAGTLPQHAGHIAPYSGQPAAAPEDPIYRQDTEQQNPPVVDKKGEGEESTTIATQSDKPPIFTRFINDVRKIICSSWVNWLLITVPVALILGAVQEWGHKEFVSPSVIFAFNAVAIIPLASLLAYATECVAMRLGDTIGALLNVTFGNAVEIIVFVLALVAGEVRIVQAAAVGSILSNLLLILGMAFVLGGLRFREQLYNPTVGQMSAGLLSLSMVSLLMPTAFHAAFNDQQLANHVVLKVSRGTSVVLLLVYCLYLLFQLKSHAFMLESTPQHVIDEESHPGVLADILNSSSSSSDDSSSTSDSDSTQTTAKRIKRALRRKRQRSNASNDVSSPNISARVLPVSRTSTGHDGVFSGDEADGESRLPHLTSDQTIVQRDFEPGEDDRASQRSRSRRKSKKSKSKVMTEIDEKSVGPSVGPSEVSVPQPRIVVVDAAVEDQPPVGDRTPRRPLHLRELSREISRDLSTVVRPAFNSHVFPHHEATARALVIPSLRHEAPRTPLSGPRRTSSMPDIRRRSQTPRPNATRAVSTQLNAPIEISVEDVWDAKQHLSRTSSVILLLVTTGLVALCAEFLVGSINYMVTSSGVSQAFIGLIILPIVGNAAEHVTAITVAYKNKMDLAINIALGSSIQIALFVTPLMVMLGWAIGSDMSLYFSLFETMSLFASAFIVNYLMIDGRSNYLEGCLLIAAYVIIAIAAFFYPQCGSDSMLC